MTVDDLFAANVPKRFLVEFGVVMLDSLVNAPATKRRIVGCVDGAPASFDCADPIQFIEAAHAVALKPWPADAGQPIAFYNAIDLVHDDGTVEHVAESAFPLLRGDPNYAEAFADWGVN